MFVENDPAAPSNNPDDYNAGGQYKPAEDMTQEEIKNHLIDFFKEELELNEADLTTELELAMSSRVSDLEDTIDIKKITHQL